MTETSLSYHRCVRTFMIFILFCTKGLYLEIGGPTMIDLKLIFNTNYASITRSVAGRGVGGFLGAAIGALLADKYEKHLDLSMGVSSSLAALFLCATPYVPSINYVWFIFFATGCLSAIVNIVGTRAALKMWKDKSSSILPLMHMGFGVGALVAPIVCSPFLAVLNTELQNTGTVQQESRYTVIHSSRVQHAYILIGVFTMAASLPFYIFQFKKSRKTKYSMDKDTKSLTQKKHKRFLDMINPATYADGNFSFGLSMMVLLFVYFFNLVGGEKAVASFVRTVSVDKFHFDKELASMMHTGFWLSLTIGRLISAIISHYIAVKTLFIIQAGLHVGSTVLLCTYGMSSAGSFMVFTLLEGLAVAPLYPQGVAYGNTQMDITGVSLMVIVFAGASGDTVYMWTAGSMYDSHGPIALYFMSAVAAIAMFVCAVMLRIISRKRAHSFPSAIPNFENQKKCCYFF